MGKREKTLLPGFNTSTSSKNTVQFQQYFKYYVCFSVPTAYRLEYDQFLFAIVAIHSSLSRNAFNTVQPGKLLKWFSSFYGWHRLLLVDLLCVEGDIRSEIGRMILNWNNRGSCWGGYRSETTQLRGRSWIPVLVFCRIRSPDTLAERIAAGGGSTRWMGEKERSCDMLAPVFSSSRLKWKHWRLA